MEFFIKEKGKKKKEEEEENFITAKQWQLHKYFLGGYSNSY